MPIIEENCLTISYGESGEGSDLVLLHAAGSSGAQWRGVLNVLDCMRECPAAYAGGNCAKWYEYTRPEHAAEDDSAQVDQLDCHKASEAALLVSQQHKPGSIDVDVADIPLRVLRCAQDPQPAPSRGVQRPSEVGR